MQTGLPKDAVVVRCRCGARIKVANPEMTETVTCGVCGCNTSLASAHVDGLALKPTSALVAAAEHGPVKHQVQMAARFVNEGKYDDALEVYLHALGEEPSHRDALYGKGYCLYKLGHVREAQIALAEAHKLGHPTAIRLLNKISSPPGGAA